MDVNKASEETMLDYLATAWDLLHLLHSQHSNVSHSLTRFMKAIDTSAPALLHHCNPAADTDTLSSQVWKINDGNE